MVNFNALSASIILTSGLSVLATPVARDNLITYSLTKKTGQSIAAIIAKDQARLAHYNSQASSSVTVTNEDAAYVAAVKVGSQTFNLVIDTGSSNTWVGAGTAYVKGSTGVSTGHSISVSYGSGSFSGTEYIDTGKFTLGSATVTKQSIGVASKSTGFTDVDGIIGFGPVDLTDNTVDGVTTVPTFMNNLLSQRVISTEVLGVSFVPVPGSDNDAANGKLTFGGTDSSRYTSPITYTSAHGPYWGVSVSAITYHASSIGSGSCIVDTGTTLILIPTSAYKKFLSATRGTTDSTGLSKFTTKPTETFSFTIGGRVLSLSPSQYLVPEVQYGNYGISGKDYYSWIGDGGSSGVNCLIGQKFLENYYSVYDTSNKRIGFARSSV